MKKGVWVILERISSQNEDPNKSEPVLWRANLALTTMSFKAPLAKTPESALDLFTTHFIQHYLSNPSAYKLQTDDDYPYGITEYAVRFIPIEPPHLKIIN